MYEQMIREAVNPMFGEDNVTVEVTVEKWVGLVKFEDVRVKVTYEIDLTISLPVLSEDRAAVAVERVVAALNSLTAIGELI